MTPIRRLLLAALALLACGPTFAQPATGYPDKPVRLLVPYPTGGPTVASSRRVRCCMIGNSPPTGIPGCTRSC